MNPLLPIIDLVIIGNNVIAIITVMIGKSEIFIVPSLPIRVDQAIMPTPRGHL